MRGPIPRRQRRAASARCRVWSAPRIEQPARAVDGWLPSSSSQGARSWGRLPSRAHVPAISHASRAHGWWWNCVTPRRPAAGMRTVRQCTMLPSCGHQGRGDARLISDSEGRAVAMQAVVGATRGRSVTARAVQQRLVSDSEGRAAAAGQWQRGPCSGHACGGAVLRAPTSGYMGKVLKRNCSFESSWSSTFALGWPR